MGRRTGNEYFIRELPLMLGGADEAHLEARFEAARQAYNALLGECLRRLVLMRGSRAYRAAAALPRGTERTQTFKKVRGSFGFGEYSLYQWANRKIGRSWLAEHVDSLTVRDLADRAFRGVSEYGVGHRGRPRFKGRNQLASVSGQNNLQGIRFKKERVVWIDLELRVQRKALETIDKDLVGRIRRVRIVRRQLSGKRRYFAQLVIAGRPAPSVVAPTQGTIGIDPGPRVFAVVSDGFAARVDLAIGSNEVARQVRVLRRGIERQRTPGRRASRRQRRRQDALGDICRRLAATRRNRLGRLANVLVRCADVIRIERNSYRSFQRMFGRSVRNAAPASFVQGIVRKAANAGVCLDVLPAELALSQTCHRCGSKRKKTLGERRHECVCGVGPVDRDLYAAWLATFVTFDPKGSMWKLDASQAKAAWGGARLRLPTASSPISVEAFVAEIERSEAASEGIFAFSPTGTERLVGAADAIRGEARDVVAQARARESHEGRPQMDGATW